MADGGRAEGPSGSPGHGGGAGLVRSGAGTSVAVVVAEAAAAGVPVHLVGPVSSPAGLYASIASVLGFPAWFGHNLDALADCLGDLSWLPDGPRLLVWVSPERLRSVDADGYAAVVDTLTRAATESAGGPRPLTVVLVGH